MNEFSLCKAIERADKVYRREKGKTFSIEYDADFTCEVIDIDKCVFNNASDRRCDWLFLLPVQDINKKGISVKKPKALYVELKGVSIDRACEQLSNTITETKSQIPQFSIEARIVSTAGRQPEILNSSSYRNVKKMIGNDIMICKVHKGNNLTHIEKLQNYLQ